MINLNLFLPYFRIVFFAKVCIDEFVFISKFFKYCFVCNRFLCHILPKYSNNFPFDCMSVVYKSYVCKVIGFNWLYLYFLISNVLYSSRNKNKQTKRFTIMNYEKALYFLISQSFYSILCAYTYVVCPQNYHNISLFKSDDILLLTDLNNSIV